MKSVSSPDVYLCVSARTNVYVCMHVVMSVSIQMYICTPCVSSICTCTVKRDAFEKYIFRGGGKQRILQNEKSCTSLIFHFVLFLCLFRALLIK